MTSSRPRATTSRGRRRSSAPSLLLAPATLTVGAIASYDVLALAAPATAAWCAFLLCRRLTGHEAAAFAGGLLFGFGTYESVEMVNHLNLALVALLPLAALLALERWEGRLSRRRFVLGLGLVLALQLWTSTEVFASLVDVRRCGLPVGGAAWCAARAVATAARHRRRGARRACGRGGARCALPLLRGALREPGQHDLGVQRGRRSGELPPCNAGHVAAPARLGLGGAEAAQQPHRATCLRRTAAAGSLAAFAVQFRRSLLARCLLAFMALAALLSLGAGAYRMADRSGFGCRGR